MHVICNEHVDHVPCSAPTSRNGVEETYMNAKSIPKDTNQAFSIILKLYYIYIAQLYEQYNGTMISCT